MDVIDREIEKSLRQRPNFQDITVSARALEGGVVKTGINYCSQIFRFTINYEQQGRKYVKSFLVKAPYSLRYYENFKKFKLFAKEIYMYNVVFPHLQSLLPHQSLQPEFYGTDGGEALILEDLSYSGYKLSDGHKQLDFEHSVAALKLLAKFHALTVKIHETEPQVLDAVRDETFLTTDFVRQRACYFRILNSRLQKVVRRAAPSYAKKHSDMFHSLKSDSTLLETVVQELGPDRYSFCVINHGDFHTHNIMFAYDELGQVKNAKCLDFQSCRWSSPAIDIIYFCITSVSPEVFEKHFNLLLETYLQTLNATLKYSKCDRKLEMDTLREDMEKIWAYWLFTLVIISPIVVSSLQNCPESSLDDEFLDDQYYVELTKFWLPYLIKKGIFSKYEEATVAVNRFSHTSRNESQTKPSRHSRRYDKAKTSNFLSGRVLLEFNSQSSILVKIPSPIDNLQMMDSIGTHHREIFMYENVLPKIFELSNGQRCAPQCHAITEHKGLVLEDLEAQGYSACDCKTQLDVEHCRVALTTLAKYHALSVKYIQDSSRNLVDAITRTPDYGPSLKTFCNDLYSRFLNLASTLVSTLAHQRLREYQKQLESKLMTLSAANGIFSGFSVIAHGNFFTYNILFKYDKSGRVEEAKMINWQMSRRTLPVLDLIFFFIGSVPFDVFKANRDAFLNLYVDTLNETLSALKCNCTYSRADLDRDLNKYKILFPIFSSCVLQIIMTTSDPLTFSFQQNNEHSADYSSAVAKWLNYFVENGIV